MRYLNKLRLTTSILIYLFIFIPNVSAQSDFGAGINLGGGTLGGNFISQGAFTSSFFIEGNPGFTGNIIFRLSVMYVTDTDVLSPRFATRYYPFVKGLSLKTLQSQDFSGHFYTEESIGLLALNDRTVGNLDTWAYGAAFSLLAGIDLRNEANSGFKLGIGGEYGLTFTNTDVRYLSIYFQTEYTF
jgi:hypothetical protein